MGDQGELTATIEGARILHEPTDGPWRQWGPYLSERQWGTVREDYSAESNPWAYFPFDHARARAYRWGEDGLAGFCDRHQHWCLSLALWNGADPFLKERLFGLANGQGNHGEDVKELYYYQDGLPSHAYMRMLYKYPLDAFPYEQLIAENARRGMDEPEFEILDTGLFDAGRYADITIEYAKAAPDDILMRVTVTSRSSALHLLHVLPQITARNIWSWDGATAKPVITGRSDSGLDLTHPQMAAMRIESEGRPPLYFCENETNPLLFGQPRAGLFKDGICNFLVKGDRAAISTQRRGTKCALHHRLILQPHEPLVIRLRLRSADLPAGGFADFDDIFAERIAETDAFHAALSSGIADPQMRLVQRQALAGLLWSKQFYDYDIRDWLRGDPAQPAPPPARQKGRNADWPHLRNRDIISMPDCWEYPWYASWDLALQALPFAMMDPQFAKEQMQLLIRDWYMHPNAQLPAYEWNFSNANPPVQGWAAMHVYETDARQTGKKDRAFLELMFQRLMLNFTWWVNRKDLRGRNLFEGGFLGLDNIEIFDRSQPLPGGWFLSQSDGTAWMAMMALDLLRMALELAPDNHVYEDAAAKLFEHFLYITAAADRRGGLWDEEDGFFYDLLESPKGETTPLRGRSLVGLIPLCVVAVLDSDCFARFPRFAGRLDWLLENRPELAALVSHWKVPGHRDRLLLSMLRRQRMTRLLGRMFDEEEFLSPHGVRSVSKVHEKQPFAFTWQGQQLELPYWPGESHSRLFGGNSNWRGPVWMPVNFMLIRALRIFSQYYGDTCTLEWPKGSGRQVTLDFLADMLARRLIGLFTPDTTGQRPAHGTDAIYAKDPAFADLVLFYEYYHGETGRGLGASHQTGWSALVALLIDRLGKTPDDRTPGSNGDTA